MTDPTNGNDIDALLRYLKSGHTPHWYDDSTRWHAALTALVAERDALLGRVAAQDQDIKALSAGNAILRGKLTESPPAANDLHERLVCAALTGLLAHPSDSHPMHNLREVAIYSATAADLTLAAMRKGVQDAK